MRSRSWRWLRTRITGLLTRPNTFVVYGHDSDGRALTAPIFANRLQAAMHPPLD
ncbi:hypothetical protein [Jatrophihabitans sp.]|uniref:hypothetical protein n=1 Tax=Jatrophihabitans sp. TaxID=1932789 RepID=UPI0030C67AC3|nr:hypothetical protein [Jatrophihabitans sp.]